MPAKKNQTRYAFYGRVSSDRQDVENSMSTQQAAAARFVEANGGKIVRSYEDEAKSGKVEQRPAFQQMIHDARGRKPSPRRHPRMETQPIRQKPQNQHNLQKLAR